MGRAKIKIADELFRQALALPTFTEIVDVKYDAEHRCLEVTVEHGSLPANIGPMPLALVVVQYTQSHYVIPSTDEPHTP